MNLIILKELLSEYFKTKPVLKAWVFGSYSRGEEKEGILEAIKRTLVK